MRTLVCSLSLLLAPAIGAQTAPPFDWQGEYSQGESTAQLSDFAEANPALGPLLMKTADAESVARARLLLKLCKGWVAPGAGLQLSREAPRVRSIRTTGEIARLYIDGVLYGISWPLTEHLPPDPIRGQSDSRVGFALARLDGGGQLMGGGKW